MDIGKEIPGGLSDWRTVPRAPGVYLRTDRRGKIWGGLVPWGMSKDAFGTCGDECPWRAGANENTVFRVSHDVRVEGQPLAAGSYGLFMVPGPEEFTIIFSRNSTSWGHYYYTSKEDALRVKVKPRKAPYTHWLTYDFVERKPAEATVALRWDELEVPVRVEVPDVDAVFKDHEYLTKLGKYEHMWGVGRHLLGSQVYDYWCDPWGRVHERWADTDRLNARTPGTLLSAEEALISQWGEDPPEKFIKHVSV